MCICQLSCIGLRLFRNYQLQMLRLIIMQLKIRSANAQGGHTMRRHPQNPDTANTYSTGILNKNESCKTIRIDLNLIFLQTRCPSSSVH
jgi:hypothetical protein